MNELYWISVLGSIGTVGTVFLVLSSVIGCVLCIVMAAFEEDGEEIPKFVLKFLKICVVIFIFSLISEIFIPSKKEMYAIWGIGSTIDYIKQNDTAKRLPDKCIKALDKWVDNLNSESTEENKN